LQLKKEVDDQIAIADFSNTGKYASTLINRFTRGAEGEASA
jgi:hypothetical protein